MNTNQTKAFKIRQRLVDMVYSMRDCPPTKRTKRKIIALRNRLLGFKDVVTTPMPKSHGKSSLLLFKYLNDLDVVSTSYEHVQMIMGILNAIPDTSIMEFDYTENNWYITYSYFGYYSIGPGARDFD